MQPPKNYTKKKRQRHTAGAGTVRCWESKLKQRLGNRHQARLFRVCSARLIICPRVLRSLSTLTLNDALLNCTSVQWTPSPPQVGVSEVGSVTLLQPEKYAGLELRMSRQQVSERGLKRGWCGCEFFRQRRGWSLRKEDVGAQESHFTGNDCPSWHHPRLVFFIVFSPVNKLWTLPDRNAERKSRDL